MQLLISSASALLRVRLSEDFSVDDMSVLEEGRGVYFGVTMDAGHFYVLVRNYELLRHADGQGPHAILIFDRDFMPCGHIPLPMEEIVEGHQMVLADGAFHVCNTNHNALTLVSKKGGILEHFHPSPHYTGRNYHHLNTVFIDAEVMVLGFANRFRNSFVMEYSRPGRQFRGVNALGFSTHNYLRTPSLQVMCDSRNGALLAWRGLRDEQGNESPVFRFVAFPDLGEVDRHTISMDRYGCYLSSPVTQHFTRALAMDEAGTLVSGLEVVSMRSDRMRTPTRLMVIPVFEKYLVGKTVRAKFHSLGHYGDVHDIRVVDRFDWGHPVVDA